MAADLSDEILFHHIFLTLPIKSLLCCRSVCKAWNHIICDPQFVKLHFNQQQNSHKLLIRIPGNKYYSFDYEEAVASKGREADAVKLNFPRKAYSPIPKLLGSYNGLVGIAIEHDRFDLGTKLVLWNPSTRELKFIPDPNPYIRCYHIVGFAYDSTIDDFKIVRVIHTPETCRVDMYSLKNNSWKIVKDTPPNGTDFKPFCRTHPHGVEVNGFIYWLLYSGCKLISNSLIVGFGLRDENFTMLTMPHDMLQPCVTIKVTHRDLRALGGCLAAFKFYHRDEFVVWTMKEPEKKERKWDKLITLSISSLDYAFTRSIKPVWIMKDGKVLLRIGFGQGTSKHDQQKFGVYDPQKKKRRSCSNLWD